MQAPDATPKTAELNTVDTVIVAVYFIVVLATGVYFWRKSRSVDGFTAAGRSLPGWVVGFSILATYVSSISFFANPGKSFGGNWNPFVFSLSIPIATWIAVRYFLPYYRRGTEVSAYSHLEKRFGPWARFYVGSLYLAMQLVRIAVVMYLMALPLQALLDVDGLYIVLVLGVTTTLYTFIGGIVAVIWTDAIQCIILMVGALICLALMLFDTPGGMSEFTRIVSTDGKFSLGSWELGLTNVAETTFWVTLLYGIAINLNNFGIDQNYVQRYVASKSDSEARKSLWIGGLTFLPLSAVFFLIGTALYVYYQQNPLPPEIAAKSDRVFPYFILTELPTGVRGLLIAAVFAAAMSTISTSLNSSATLILTDHYKRYINPSAGEGRSMMVLYGATIIIGVLGTAMAVYFVRAEPKSALDAWWILSGIFTGGMIGIFLLGMVARRAGNAAAVLAVILGTMFIAWLTIPKAYKALPDLLGKVPEDPSIPMSPFNDLLIAVFGMIFIVLVGALLGLIFPRRDVDAAAQ